MPDRGRIFFPANVTNDIFYQINVTNSRDRRGNVSFRINVKEGRMFKNLQYKLGNESWKAFLPRNISANLYIVRLESNEMERLSLRLSTGDESIVLTSVNIQFSAGVIATEVPPPRIETKLDIKLIPQPLTTFTSDITIQKNDIIIPSIDMDIRIVPKFPGTYIDWSAGNIDLSNGKVSRIIDQSGNNNHGVQTESSNMPSYMMNDPECNNSPSIIIDGTENVKSWLSTEGEFTPPLQQPVTLILVMTEVGNDAGIYLSGSTVDFGVDTNNRYTMFTSTNSIVGDPATNNTSVFVNLINTNNTTSYKRGVPILRGILNNVDIDDLTLGDPNSPHREFRMVRLIMWNRLLTHFEINQMGAFLSRECGIMWESIDPHINIIMDIGLSQKDRPTSFSTDISVLKSNNIKTYSADIRTTRFNTTQFKVDVVIVRTIASLVHFDWNIEYVQLVSGRVQRILDQSGNNLDGGNANGVPYNMSDSNFNNNPSIGLSRFNIIISFISDVIDQPYMVFTVLKDNNLDSGATYFVGNDDSGNNSTFFTGNNVNDDYGIRISRSPDELLSGGVRDDKPHVFLIIFNGNNSMLLIDGGTPVIKGFAGLSNSRFFVMSSSNAPPGTDFDMTRTALYTRILSLDEINQTGTALAQKYGTTWNNVTIHIPRQPTFNCDIILSNEASTEVKFDITLSNEASTEVKCDIILSSI